MFRRKRRVGAKSYRARSAASKTAVSHGKELSTGAGSVRQAVDRGYSVSSVATRLDITINSLLRLDKEIRVGFFH